MLYFFDLGVLITGGWNRKSVEIYLPDSYTRCSLPNLPAARYTHTQDGELACGGGCSRCSSVTGTCVKWSSESGSWTKSHTLRQRRYLHVSWATVDGVYLMGGMYSKKTTELVKEDGTVEDGFSLKYDIE